MAFEHLQAAISDGIAKRLHTCVQVCVSIDGVTQINAGFGEATAQTTATSETIMLWRSAGKPLTAVAILRLAEQEQLSVDDPLRLHLTETCGTPWEHLTLTQLLTHATGLPAQSTPWPDADWKQILRDILATADQPDDSVAAYQPQATWFLLGEIVRRQQQSATFPDALRELVLQPLGMSQCGCGLRPAEAAAQQARLPDLLIRERTELRPSTMSTGAALHNPSPGGNLRGPVSDLVLFYEMLLRRGRLADGTVFLQERSVEQMTRPHRTGQFDQTLQHVVDMGLGCITNSQHHGATVPYGYSRFSSPDAFGHGGAQCSIGFCDPAHRLVVAWAANGFCSEPQHQRRNRAINEAIFQDLQLID